MNLSHKTILSLCGLINYGERIMFINVAGTSKVSLVMCKILAKKDFSIGYVISRSREKAAAFVRKIGQGTPVSYDEDFLLRDVVFISVPDSVISSVYSNLKEKLSVDVNIYHFSGFLSSDIFEDADERGWGRGSIHPNLSFADEKIAFKLIEKCCFGIEGNEKGLDLARKIVQQISNYWVEITPQAKVAYHLAAVLASNFNVGLAYLAKKLYDLYGINGFEKIIPSLMMSTSKNISTLGVKPSLTGPVARGDWDVVENEGKFFENCFPKYKDLYMIMTEVLREIKER